MKYQPSDLRTEAELKGTVDPKGEDRPSRVSLDASAFPHLFEAVLEAASYQTLVVLRGTSRAVKAAADARIAKIANDDNCGRHKRWGLTAGRAFSLEMENNVACVRVGRDPGTS